MFQAAQLRQQISHNHLDAAFQYLNQWAKDNKMAGLQTQLGVLQARYDKLQREKRLGILSYEEENRSHNRLTYDLLELADKLEKGSSDFGIISPPEQPGQTTTINITQNHYGSGDNVAGDKKEEK